MSNKKILILEGGYNEEHNVSLSTSREIQKVLKNNKIKFRVLKVNPKNIQKKIIKYKDYICFNALHGTFGEDGEIQKILRKHRIKFTHSNIKSSKICSNKIMAKTILLKKNIFTPNFITLKVNKINREELFNIKKKFKRFIVKPNNSGSSYGISIIKNNTELNKFIININKFKKNLFLHEDILFEEYISGKELTVSTIKFGKKIEALGVTEIKSNNRFFDYKAKYTKGFSKHIIPAKIDPPIYKKCLKLATKAHKLLGCNSIARTDFIFDTNKNKIYFLEINTQPGLTPVSLLPEQARYNNISFSDMIINILKKLN